MSVHLNGLRLTRSRLKRAKWDHVTGVICFPLVCLGGEIKTPGRIRLYVRKNGHTSTVSGGDCRKSTSVIQQLYAGWTLIFTADCRQHVLSTAERLVSFGDDWSCLETIGVVWRRLELWVSWGDDVVRQQLSVECCYRLDDVYSHQRGRVYRRSSSPGVVRPSTRPIGTSGVSCGREFWSWQIVWWRSATPPDRLERQPIILVRQDILDSYILYIFFFPLIG